MDLKQTATLVVRFEIQTSSEKCVVQSQATSTASVLLDRIQFVEL